MMSTLDFSSILSNTYFTSIVPTSLFFNVTGQLQANYKPASIKEVRSNSNSFQALLCTMYTHCHSFNPDIHLHLHSTKCTVEGAGGT